MGLCQNAASTCSVSHEDDDTRVASHRHESRGSIELLASGGDGRARGLVRGAGGRKHESLDAMMHRRCCVIDADLPTQIGADEEDVTVVSLCIIQRSRGRCIEMSNEQCFWTAELNKRKEILSPGT